ncbi:hypothetical protein [Xylanibacter oryzae]|uniref:hypothetical protein n=1 Tax=Xylanibacter oryzae TaxID=185293 RepID=UPI0004BC90C0|nr:hypothetical protein [Xylanibacter oryzae]
MTNVPGGWSQFRSPTKDEETLFKEVMGVILGVRYNPIVVASQVVNGTNYCFICRAIVVTNPPFEYNVMVYIYKPLEAGGKPYCTDIKRI